MTRNRREYVDEKCLWDQIYKLKTKWPKMAQYHQIFENGELLSDEFIKMAIFSIPDSCCPKLTVTSSRSFLSTGTLEVEVSGILAYKDFGI